MLKYFEEDLMRTTRSNTPVSNWKSAQEQIENTSKVLSSLVRHGAVPESKQLLDLMLTLKNARVRLNKRSDIVQKKNQELKDLWNSVNDLPRAREQTWCRSRRKSRPEPVTNRLRTNISANGWYTEDPLRRIGTLNQETELLKPELLYFGESPAPAKPDPFMNNSDLNQYMTCLDRTEDRSGLTDTPERTAPYSTTSTDGYPSIFSLSSVTDTLCSSPERVDSPDFAQSTLSSPRINHGKSGTIGKNWASNYEGLSAEELMLALNSEFSVPYIPMNSESRKIKKNQ